MFCGSSQRNGGRLDSKVETGRGPAIKSNEQPPCSSLSTSAFRRPPVARSQGALLLADHCWPQTTGGKAMFEWTRKLDDLSAVTPCLPLPVFAGAPLALSTRASNSRRSPRPQTRDESQSRLLLQRERASTTRSPLPWTSPATTRSPQRPPWTL